MSQSVSQSSFAALEGAERAIAHNRAPWNNLVCGALVFGSRWVIAPTSTGSDWNFFWSGTAIMFIAFCALIAHGNVSKNYWSLANVAAGLWLIVSTSIIPGPPHMMYAQICLGVLTVTIALTSLANERVR
jgi:hypothetical protein